MTETNTTLAGLFDSMADLLAVKRENPHRIRAYRRGADALRNLAEDVAAITQRGELRGIPGIGRELSSKIEEFLATRTIQSYERLKIPLPPDLTAWCLLPGLSETVVQHLYFRLGIRTLSDLETLVRSHLLRTLPGVTASENELLPAIIAAKAQKDATGA